jgi:two-component system, cell cycle response regulator DivK
VAKRVLVVEDNELNLKLFCDLLRAHGHETEAIRRDVILRRTPVMAVTAYAGKGDEERIREAGADAYVSKPISLMRFIEVIGELGAIADARAMV